MHWGKEYQLHPNRRQLSIAKYLHSLGVSAVIGAHPHVLQPHSRTTDHLTAYSVGNFLFPQIKECLTVGFLFQSCRVHWLSEMKPQGRRKLITNFPHLWRPQRTLTIVIQQGITLKVFQYGVKPYHGGTLCFLRYSTVLQPNCSSFQNSCTSLGSELPFGSISGSIIQHQQKPTIAYYNRADIQRCVAHCFKHSVRNKEEKLYFFAIPKERIIMKEWLDIIGHRTCSAHFHGDMKTHMINIATIFKHKSSRPTAAKLHAS
jgi:hypothetical protein